MTRHLIATITLIPIIIVGFCIRLMRPELTETQLFLEFWRWWLAVLLWCVLLAWWTTPADRRPFRRAKRSQR